MPLPDFLQSYAPAYGETWCGAVAYMRTSPTESVTVARLRAQYRRDGRFARPVRVRPQGVVGNGMHRIAALIGEQARFVDVTDEPGEPTGVLVTVEFSASPEPEPFDDLLANAVRSFPLDDHAWVEGFGLSFCDGVYEDTFEVPSAMHVDALVARLAEEAARVGAAITTWPAVARTPREWDEWIEASTAG